MKPRMLLIAVLTAAALLCAGCGNASHTQSRTITDMKGRNVVLNEDVTRVVALTAADCEIIYAIGAGDVVVGRGPCLDNGPETVLRRKERAIRSQSSLTDSIRLSQSLTVFSIKSIFKQERRILFVVNRSSSL